MYFNKAPSVHGPCPCGEISHEWFPKNYNIPGAHLVTVPHGVTVVPGGLGVQTETQKYTTRDMAFRHRGSIRRGARAVRVLGLFCRPFSQFRGN